MNSLPMLLSRLYYKIMPIVNKKAVINHVYNGMLGRKINWTNPSDLNEKINWLKIYSDTSQWSRLADKYNVRKFIADKGYESILVPLYGVWDSAYDIDFDNLPKSFVLKTNHGSGDCIIVKDKGGINRPEVRCQVQLFLKEKYGLKSGEYHYSKIKPKVVAEKLLIQDSDFSDTLIDYKVFCFNGTPFCIWTCYNRTKTHVYVETHDLEWNYHPEYSIFTNVYRDGKGIIPKPAKLEEMLDIAKNLAQGFPQVRVDFYIVNNQIYFGEMTFTSEGGYMQYFTPEFLKVLGAQFDLKNKI